MCKIYPATKEIQGPIVIDCDKIQILKCIYACVHTFTRLLASEGPGEVGTGGRHCVAACEVMAPQQKSSFWVPPKVPTLHFHQAMRLIGEGHGSSHLWSPNN